MTSLSVDARNVNWLVNSFVDQVPGVSQAMVVSADGLVLAASDGLNRHRAQQLAAIASGLWSLALGGAQLCETGSVVQSILEMQRGLLFVSAIRDGSCLTILAAKPCDIGVVGFEMGRLVTRVGEVLTPALRTELSRAHEVGVS